MRESFSAIWQAASVLFGLAVLIAIIWAFSRIHARMWRLVAARYSGPAGDSVAKKVPETIVIARRAGPHSSLRPSEFRQYGAAAMGLQEDALTIAQILPFNLFCPPVLLPFDQMELVSTNWALWPEPYAIRMARLPNVDIVLGRDTVQWIRSQTDAAPFGLGA